ncbi:hypothetical protein ACFVW1_25685 [Streptomyces olivochromogenes]|uniref:hypothetical protein n=1 Tax=Streptomyces olivochromogenes TaxID=1963 RepID=UPI0036DAD0B0
MPATITEEPLAVHFLFNDGSQWSAALDGLPNPDLARDLAQGLAANAHPHGGIGAKTTAAVYAVSLRQMVIKLASAGFAGSASDLTRPALMRFWIAGRHEHERNTRMILKGLDAVTGALRPEVREYLAGNKLHAKPRTQPYGAYTDSEWERLESACRKLVDDSWACHKRALALAAGGTDPRISGRHSEADIGWLLLRDGPIPFRHGYEDYVHGHVKGVNRESEPMLRQIREALFPTQLTQYAYMILFGMYSGIVPDGIDDLGLGDVEWAGDSTVLLSYVKGRTSRESLNLPGRAVRLLERWLEFSGPARRFADEEHRSVLWIAHTPHSRRAIGIPSGHRTTRQRLKRGLGVVDDAGMALAIHRGRIRATYQERLSRRGWTGRATIDPNHTARVEGDHYVTPTTPAQLEAVESIIEDGQTAVLRKSLPPVVLSTEQTAELAKGFPDAVSRLGLDAAALAELVGGERDVFTAACADQLAGVHGPAGQPCPARPWVCLLCPLAVFLPRHAPNLLRLDAFFSRQFQQMPTENFLRVFGPYAERLSNEILPKFSEEAKSKGRSEVADDDSDLPLRPEEGTL